MRAVSMIVRDNFWLPARETVLHPEGVLGVQRGQAERIFALTHYQIAQRTREQRAADS